MKKYLFSVLIVIFVTSSPSYGVWLKNIAHITNADCLTTDDMNSKKHLGYRILEATEKESQLIQRTVDTFLAHNSNNLERVLKGASFKVVTDLKSKDGSIASGKTHVRNRVISLDRKKISDSHVGVGIIAHEICHLLVTMKLRGEHENVYWAYEDAVPTDKGKCHPSKYSERIYKVKDGESRIEEIAEICSAHLFAPGYVGGRSKKACKNSHNFMKALFAASTPRCRRR